MEESYADAMNAMQLLHRCVSAGLNDSDHDSIVFLENRRGASGGSGANEAKVFDRSRGNAVVGTIGGLSRGVFTLDFSPSSSGKKMVAVGGGDKSIHVYEIVSK